MKTFKLIIVLALLTSFFVSCTPQDSLITDATSQDSAKPSVVATSGNGSESVIKKGD